VRSAEGRERRPAAPTSSGASAPRLVLAAPAVATGALAAATPDQAAASRSPRSDASEAQRRASSLRRPRPRLMTGERSLAHPHRTLPVEYLSEDGGRTNREHSGGDPSPLASVKTPGPRASRSHLPAPANTTAAPTPASPPRHTGTNADAHTDHARPSTQNFPRSASSDAVRHADHPQPLFAVDAAVDVPRAKSQFDFARSAGSAPADPSIAARPAGHPQPSFEVAVDLHRADPSAQHQEEEIS
jgi:hypothetical protein